jgi:hypothetical protein
MKKILLLSLSIFLLGCLKTDLPTTTSVGEWVLIDAKLYIKRWGNYPLKKYDYFTLTQTTNCLDLTNNSIKLDEIAQYSTKWTLPKTRGFILNDTVEYEDQSSATFIRIYPTEDGSARIFLLDNLKENYVRWKSSEREQALTINGVKDNYTYYSKLTFKRISTNAINNLEPDFENLVSEGVVPSNNMYDNGLVGQSWVIYRYKLEGFNSYQYISDTLHFLTKNMYYYNSEPQQFRYSLYNMGGYYSMSINHTRFGSSISASNVPEFGIKNGDLRDIRFKDNTIGVNGEYYYLSIKKIN